jgi:hypothetical protein
MISVRIGREIAETTYAVSVARHPLMLEPLLYLQWPDGIRCGSARSGSARCDTARCSSGPGAIRLGSARLTVHKCTVDK